MNNFGLLLRKYSVPAIFTIIGILVLAWGIKNSQPVLFLLATGMMFVAGILSTLYSMGKLKPAVVYATGILVGIVALVLIIFSYKGVSTTLKYETDRDKCIALAEQNLMDIRFVQKVHYEKTGRYISDWDEFVEFVKTGTMPNFVSKGTVPGVKIIAAENDYLYGDNRPIDNSMTEQEAYRLSKWKEGPRYDTLFAGFVRDTVQVSILKVKFNNRAYRENREKLGFYPFSADSLPYIPYTGSKKMWNLEVKDSITVSEVVGGAIYVSGTLPFGKTEGSAKKIKMSFGNLSSFDLDGSWEKE